MNLKVVTYSIIYKLQVLSFLEQVTFVVVCYLLKSWSSLSYDVY